MVHSLCTVMYLLHKWQKTNEKITKKKGNKNNIFALYYFVVLFLKAKMMLLSQICLINSELFPNFAHLEN